jgi:hypothetical protein
VKFAALLAALVIVAGSFQITRPGYSVDEEFTEFAVRGIHAHGVPTLPSGLLYDRGLAYSYASALVNGRVVSLSSAALVVLLTFILVRRHVNPTAGLLAAVLVTTSIPFWATATTARFYAPFLATFLAALVVIDRPVTLIAVALLARLLHELGFLIAAIPFVCMLFARGQRRTWLLSTAAVVAGLVLGQLLLFAMHALEPSSGATMVRRFFLWQVVNLFERPGDRQFGIALVVAVVGMVIAPKHAWWWLVSGLSIAVMIIAFSIARASNTAALSIDLVAQVLRDGSRYPLDMFWHVARTMPFTVLLALGGIFVRSVGDWPPAQRAAHLLWIGWMLWFGVIESGLTTNYLLLPVSFMLIAIAIDLAAVTRNASLPKAWATLVAVVMAFLIFSDQWDGEGGLLARLEAARPTIHIEGIDEIRDSLQPNDRVVCTDELGCLMLVGRIDRWLALDDYVRERFLVRRSPDRATGVYTGVAAVFRPGEVFSPNEDGSLPDRTIVIDIFKDYPIGNSRSWLPKAIEEDGLQVRPLLETPQARVLQVSPPERLAHMQP